MLILYLMMLQVCFLILLSLEAFASDIIKENSCITPYLENATCKPLFDCDAIKSAFMTLTTDKANEFLKDSQCGCDMGNVCCGSFYNKTYPSLINCVPVPEEENIILSRISDQTTCGLDETTDKIQGGTVAKFEEFPWLAALEYDSKLHNTSAGIRCGGSLLNHVYILTAAHCMLDIEFKVTKAWLGATNISSEENCLNLTGTIKCINSVRKINIKQIIPHPFYQSIEKINDIGLLQLEKNIEYSDYIRPICLPSPDFVTPRTGTFMTAAGWGATEYRGSTSNIKLKVELPVQDDSLCNKFLKLDYKMISSKQLCVGGERRKDSCQGDSGGPLMKEFINPNGDPQWYQGGIVSYGSGCGIRGRPGVYTKVSAYVVWIYNTINKQFKTLERGEPCTTPNATVGTCVPLNTCEVVFKAVSTKYDDGYHFAHESYCGNGDTEQLVCCESPGSTILPNFNSKALPNKTTCGVMKEERGIIGGAIADLGEFPWVVGIEYKSKIDDNDAGIRCIGSVINNRYVLTAARCFTDTKYEPVSVRLGDWNTTTGSDCKELVANVECPVQKIRIKKIIPYAFYLSIVEQNNIGLILLENEIKFSDYVSPICLPSPNLPSLEVGTLMTVVGWGKTENDSRSGILRKVEIPLVSNEKCSMILETVEELITINSLQLCAGSEKNKESCDRDAGGPLMSIYEDKATGKMQWYQDGLVPHGILCGKEFGIYTRVASYMDWILNIISED